MRRRTTVIIVALASVVFLAISFELARFLSASSSERDAVYALIEDQTRGDAGAARARLADCGAPTPCGRSVGAVVAKLKRPGEPKILSYESKTSYALTAKTAPARVAWAIVSANGLPIVQCVTVRRRWSFLSGASVSLRRLSAPIGNEASC